MDALLLSARVADIHADTPTDGRLSRHVEYFGTVLEYHAWCTHAFFRDFES